MGGLLLVQVPDCGQNPFMFLVADHASHCFVPPLRELVESAGFEVIVAAPDWVAKEITIVARKSGAGPRPMRATGDLTPAVLGQLEWLTALAKDTRALAAAGPLGIFGTSIAATWLQGELGGRAAFFVDEDPSRPGQSFMGRTILRPADAPAGCRVMLALPAAQAADVRARLNRQYPAVDFRLPPAAPA